jgi:glycosyltransferase involved in cell wall biosynthesis
VSALKRKRILLLCPYPVGVAPGQRLKYEQYFGYFAERGYDLTVSPFFSRRAWAVLYRRGNWAEKAFWVLAGYARRVFDLARLPFHDGAYVFLHATPFGGSLFEACVRALSRRMVYDIDDLVFLPQHSAQNGWISRLRRPGKIHYLMARADHVITCTPFLDSYVKKLNPRTTDISSTIRTDVYQPANRYRNDRPLTIGWSGSHSTVKYVNLIAPALRALARTHNFRLKVIGAVGLEIPGIKVDCQPWTEATEVADLSEFDVGIYPLPDEEWVHGKSGLKALQYMALGIPTVATAIGANFRVIEHGESGFLVNESEEWRSALARLLDDPALRERVGAKARDRVVSTYSVLANEPRYGAVLDEVFRGEATCAP